MLIGGLAVIGLGGMALAMMSYAGRRTEEMRREEAAKTKASPTRGEQRTKEAQDLLARKNLEQQPFQKATADKEIARQEAEAQRQRAVAAETRQKLEEAQRVAATDAEQRQAAETKRRIDAEAADRRTRAEAEAKRAPDYKAPLKLSDLTSSDVLPLARPKLILRQTGREKAAETLKLKPAEVLQSSFADQVPVAIKDLNQRLFPLSHGLLGLSKDGMTLRFYDVLWKEFRTFSLQGLFDQSSARDSGIDFTRSVEHAAAFGDSLYLNIGCARTYSSVFKGDCGFLMAVDINTRVVKWRSLPLVSTGSFIVDHDIIISGYGFTREDDYVFAIEATTGKVLQKIKLDTAPDEMELNGSALRVLTDGGFLYTFDIATRTAAVPAPVTSPQRTTASPTSGNRIAVALEDAFGPCPFCDDVRKLVTPAEFAQLQSIPDMIERTWLEVQNRKGPREDAAARRILEQLVAADLTPDPLAAVKTGKVKCTTYHFGFLDNAAERVGTHQCMVRMVRIGGELSSLTLEKETGDGFHGSFKRYRVNAMAWIGRTSLKGHQQTRYNLAVPRNAENTNFGNKVGILVSLGGKPALLSLDQSGFTSPDPTFFEVTVLE